MNFAAGAEIARRFFVGWNAAEFIKFTYKSRYILQIERKRKRLASLQALILLVGRQGLEPRTKGL
jgi:hypothetical protein